MERVPLVEPNPRRTGQSFEVIEKIQEQLVPVIDFASSVHHIPDSDLVVSAGRSLFFYNPNSRVVKEQVIPATVQNEENRPVYTEVSPDGKYVVAFRENGPAQVFNGQTGEKYDFDIAPNEVGPRVLKRFESELQTAEELEEKKNQYCGIRGFQFSMRGRYTIVNLKNRTSRVFDFKRGEYISSAHNTYNDQLQFDDNQDSVSYEEYSKQRKSLRIELVYDEKDSQDIKTEEEIRVSFDSSSYPRHTSMVFDRSKNEFVRLEGVRYIRQRDGRYALGVTGDSRSAESVSLIYDVETGSRIDLTPFANFISDLTISRDGKYAYYVTTLNGLPPRNISPILRSVDEQTFRLKVIDLQEMKPVPIPDIRLFAPRTNRTILPLGNNSEVLVVQRNGQVVQLNVEKIAQDEQVSNFLETAGDMSAEIIQIADNLKRRNVIPDGGVGKDMWAQFLSGQSGLTPDMLSEATKLQAIQLRDGGNAITSTAYISLAHLSHSGKLALDNIPGITVKRPEIPKLGNIPFVVKRDIQQLMSGTEKIEVFGRTIVVTKGGQLTAVKLQRDGESLHPLVDEGAKMAFLHSLKSEVGLLSELPSPRFNHEQYLRRIRVEYLPEEIRQQVEKTVTIHPGNNFAVGLIFDAPADYFSYHHELSDQKAEVSTQKAMHDLFRLASVGYIHPDLIELFHNQIQRGRPDSGKYIWNIDVVRPMRGRFGAGRLHAWERTVDYPNFGPSGLRDFAELAGFNEIYSPYLANKHIHHLSTNLLRLPEEIREKVTLQYFLGNYMLAWTLTEGRRLHDAQALTADNLQNISRQIQGAFEAAYRSFSGRELDEAFAGTQPINWDRFARQMQVFMTDEYTRGFILPDILPDVFGRPIRIVPGDGWGHIDRDLLTENLKKSGVDDVETVINRYFEAAKSSRRQIPDNILTFRQPVRQYEESVRALKIIFGESQDEDKLESAPPPQVILDLFDRYGKGMRANGRDEDLGPINGPLPLTELINANYLLTTAAIASRS